MCINVDIRFFIKEIFTIFSIANELKHNNVGLKCSFNQNRMMRIVHFCVVYTL